MKKRVLFIMLAAVVLLSACGITGGNQSGLAAQSQGQTQQIIEPQKISAEDAHDRMNDEGERIVLDVRTAEEYAEAHIPGAILLSNEEIGDVRPEQLPVLDTEILIYCRSGNRSAQAAEKLTALGYRNLYDFGGIKDWPYETAAGAFEEPEKAGTLASFTTYDLQGIQMDESIFADYSLTMINIWATFCGPCLREMPELGQLSDEYADQGVQIIGIVADVPQNDDGTFDQAQVETARELVDETGADYLHLLPSMDLVSAKLKSVSSVPETIFVDRDGNLVGKSYIGSRSGDDWAKIIESLLPEVA